MLNKTQDATKPKIQPKDVIGDLTSTNKNYFACSETNQRDNNEDSFLLFQFSPGIAQPTITVLAIADGMGGHEHGEHVSSGGLRRFSRALFESLIIEKSLNKTQDTANISNQDIIAALESALEQTNAYIHSMVETNKWERAGSTIVIAIIYENSAIITNLGDSPLYHFHLSTEKLTELTEDHSIAGILLRTKQISPEMARVHSGRNQLEYFLGAPRLPNKLPITTISLSNNDILLLCSDGVSSKLEIEQISSILKIDSPLALKANTLIEEALKANETDNQTLILWQHQIDTPQSVVSKKSSSKRQNNNNKNKTETKTQE